MSDLVLGLILVVVLSGLTLLAFQRTERRAWRRYEQWECPVCGGVFGHQEPRGAWATRDGPAPKTGRSNRGPRLRCRICNREFRFTAGGIHETGCY